MDWSLNWNAVGAIAQAVAAIATFLAVFVALYISNKQIKESRLQATEERQDQSRPIVVPTGDITGPPGFYLPDGYIPKFGAN